MLMHTLHRPLVLKFIIPPWPTSCLLLKTGEDNSKTWVKSYKFKHVSKLWPSKNFLQGFTACWVQIHFGLSPFIHEVFADFLSEFPPKILCKTRQSDFSEYTSLCRYRSYNVQSLFVMMNNVSTMQQAQQFYFLFEILLREGQFPLQFHHHNFPSLVCCSKILDKVIFVLFCAMFFRQIWWRWVICWLFRR